MLDGTSNTAAISERAIGDQIPGSFNIKGDWVVDTGLPAALGNPTDANTQLIRNACLANTSKVDGDSLGGQNWFNGNYRISLYNHTIPPNKKAVKIAAGAGVAGCHPATSYHPGGVNLLLADGSTRFIRDAISANVWDALGGRFDGKTIAAGSF